MYVCMSVNLDYYRWRNDDGVNLWRRMLDWIGDIWMICGWFHLDITHISRYHPHIYQISPTYHPDIIHISPTYHPDITHISSIYHPHILQISHGQYFLQPPNLVKSQVLTQIWHDYCRKNSTLKSHHPDITQISSKYHLEIIQKSSRNHQEVIKNHPVKNYPAVMKVAFIKRECSAAGSRRIHSILGRHIKLTTI